MFYKNTSYFVKTFYGVTFQPQEIKEVGEYINDKFFVLVDDPKAKPVSTQQKRSSDQSNKKVVPKREESKAAPKAIDPKPIVPSVTDAPAEVEAKLESTEVADSELVVPPAKEPTKSSINKERKS